MNLANQILAGEFKGEMIRFTISTVIHSSFPIGEVCLKIEFRAKNILPDPSNEYYKVNIIDHSVTPTDYHNYISVYIYYAHN